MKEARLKSSKTLENANQSILTEWSMVAWGRGSREGQEKGISKGHKKYLVGVINIFTILIVVMGSWVYTYVKIYQIVHLKCVQFIVCQSYLNRGTYIYAKQHFNNARAYKKV